VLSASLVTKGQHPRQLTQREAVALQAETRAGKLVEKGLKNEQTAKATYEAPAREARST
jgi:hypothetical protein